MIIKKPDTNDPPPDLVCKPEVLRESKRKTFTDLFVRGAAAGQIFSDLGCKGLRLRVSPDGATRSFFHSFQLPGQGENGKRGEAKRGKTKKIAVGHFPEVTLAEARRIVNEQRESVDVGINPAIAGLTLKSDRRPEATGKTFREVAEIALGDSDNQTTRNDVKHYLLPRLGKRPIDAITRKELAKVLDKIDAPEAPSRAGRVLGHLVAIYKVADSRGYVENNPTLRMSRKHKSVARTRVLTKGELGRVWKATTPDAVGAAIRLMILCGQRRTETGLTQWDQLDLDEGVWTIPWQNRKNGNAQIGDHSVYLPRQAVEMLQALRDRRAPDAGPYCFSVKNGHSPVTGWVAAKALIDEKVKIPAWVIHELRHTAVSGMASLGISPHIVSKVVSHTLGRTVSAVTSGYVHADFQAEKAAALQAWADQLFPPPVDNVVKLDMGAA